MAYLGLLSVPIGNILDLTQRAHTILSNETHFIVEDGRMFKKLLNQLGITLKGKVLITFHDHSSKKQYLKVLGWLAEDKNCFIVSDAGSPIISDPAYPLIQKVLANGYSLQSIPGVSSLIVALELSGLPPHPFHFYGFFPREQEKQKEMSLLMQQVGGTFLFFESPHRIFSSLEYITQLIPSASLAVGRELTKKFETIHRFMAKDFKAIKEQMNPKGEFVFLVYMEKRKGSLAVGDDIIRDKALEILQKGAKPKLIAKLLSTVLDKNSKEIYQQLENIRIGENSP